MAVRTRKRRYGYLRQRFAAREFPKAIFLPGPGDDPERGEECIAGPFCRHCGNPYSLHGVKLRCPDRHLHPLFPPPRLPTR